jgi:protein involved in polysaccharide export with SLBB domain
LNFLLKTLKARIWLLLLLLLGMQTAVLPQTESREIRLMAADAIHVYIYDSFFPTEKGKFISLFHDKEFVLDGTGNITLGPLGKVPVAGLKAEEIAEVLKEKLKPFAKEPLIMVVPMIRIFLRGGFSEAGLHRFNPEMSFWEMVKEVGGLNSLSSFEDMFVMRNGEVIYRNFDQAFYKGQALYELGLQSGDEIFAPRVNRLTFDNIMRYLQFGMSMLIFYFSIANYKTK